MTQFTTSVTRWHAVQTRNPLAASSFIYSVITTRIYCRPTCPSRVARRANVTFHDSAAAAEADGFRPCKRCRPDVKEDSESDRQKKLVVQACEFLRKEKGQKIKWSVKDLAKEVGLTESHFCRVFKKVMGMTIGEYRSSLVNPKNDIEESLGTDGANLASQTSNFRHQAAATSAVPWSVLDTLDLNPNLQPDMDTNLVLFDFNMDLSPENCSGLSTPAPCANEDGFQFFDFGALSENPIIACDEA